MTHKLKMKKVQHPVGTLFEVKQGNKKIGHIYQSFGSCEVKSQNKIRYFDTFEECEAWLEEVNNAKF
jgi:hypothetical protein